MKNRYLNEDTPDGAFGVNPREAKDVEVPGGYDPDSDLKHIVSMDLLFDSLAFEINCDGRASDDILHTASSPR